MESVELSQPEAGDIDQDTLDIINSTLAQLRMGKKQHYKHEEVDEEDDDEIDTDVSRVIKEPKARGRGRPSAEEVAHQQAKTKAKKKIVNNFIVVSPQKKKATPAQLEALARARETRARNMKAKQQEMDNLKAQVMTQALKGKSVVQKKKQQTRHVERVVETTPEETETEAEVEESETELPPPKPKATRKKAPPKAVKKVEKYMSEAESEISEGTMKRAAAVNLVFGGF